MEDVALLVNPPAPNLRLVFVLYLPAAFVEPWLNAGGIEGHKVDDLLPLGANVFRSHHEGVGIPLGKRAHLHQRAEIEGALELVWLAMENPIQRMLFRVLLRSGVLEVEGQHADRRRDQHDRTENSRVAHCNGHIDRARRFYASADDLP